MSGGTGIRARLRIWYRQRFVSSSLTSCTNESIAKLVEAAVCKTAIICSNQIGVSKCTSGGTVYTPASGAVPAAGVRVRISPCAPYMSLAQLAEQRIFNPWGQGSNP